LLPVYGFLIENSASVEDKCERYVIFLRWSRRRSWYAIFRAPKSGNTVATYKERGAVMCAKCREGECLNFPHLFFSRPHDSAAAILKLLLLLFTGSQLL
jgi:hypothetical protein